MREDGYLGMGREVRAFEEELQAYLGGRRTARSSASIPAPRPCIWRCRRSLSPGDEVLVQSLTFVASFQAISAAGAVPVACEVYPETVTLDLEDAARRITPRTRAVMPVHYASNPGDLEAIYDFARRHGLRVIEDAAHAFGCTYKGGRSAPLATWSASALTASKISPAAKGGPWSLRTRRLFKSVQDARLLGVQRDTEKRYQGARSWEFDVQHQGYRYHLSNLFAAMGRVQLRRFEGEFKPRRVALSQKYRAAWPARAMLQLFAGRSGPDCPPYFSHPGVERQAGWAAAIFAGPGD